MSRAGYYQWAAKNGIARRSINNNGYVIVGPTFVAPEDLPLFRAMQNRGITVMEHRMVMARHLGRPLTSNECIDHMDGNKTNNDIKNLRLYVRGKQQPGSCPAHGTYYHEWQMAEKQIKTLEARIAKLTNGKARKRRRKSTAVETSLF